MKVDNRFGFARVAVASPKLRVADTRYNAAETIKVMQDAHRRKVDILVFPELGLTSYTCKDLFHQETLLAGALDALDEVVRASARSKMLITVGFPLRIDGGLYNCAAVIHNGKILGVVPKSYLPNYKNFEEKRWFSEASKAAHIDSVELLGKTVPFGTNLLFSCSNMPGLVFAIEICEDGWVPVSPGSIAALFGAVIIGNPSASNDTLLKAAYRRQLFGLRSSTCLTGYMYASAGVFESSGDMVFGGHCMVHENGSLLTENKRFVRGASLQVSDIDVGRLLGERMVTNSFTDNRAQLVNMLKPEALRFRTIPFEVQEVGEPRRLLRQVDGHPFVPKGAELKERCEEISNIQFSGLAQRIETVASELHTLYGTDGQTSAPTAAHLARFKGVIGVSGGLDSTLALLQAVRAFDLLGIPRANILGITMPGFGTTSRTKNNAVALMDQLGITKREVNIRGVCVESMVAEDVRPFGINVRRLQEAVAAAAAGGDTEAEALKKEFGVELKVLHAAVDATTPGATGLERTKQLVVEALHEMLRNLTDEQRAKGDLRFENLQARERTKILMQNGFVLGTGDLSELAKGWCTYNGDHMSMYNVNGSVPKTLVKWIVDYLAHHNFDGDVRNTLIDIVGTVISPELLPTGKDGEVKQKTEDAVGPYELTDFFLYYLVRFGFSPEKILYLASHATFDTKYSEDEIRHWLCDFIERFFRQQFKRSALPDGPKVGISFSPRGDWRMPTDACAAMWLAWLDAEERDRRFVAKGAMPRSGSTKARS